MARRGRPLAKASGATKGSASLIESAHQPQFRPNIDHVLEPEKFDIFIQPRLAISLHSVTYSGSSSSGPTLHPWMSGAG